MMVFIRTHGMGYLKVDSSSHQFLQAGEAFLRSRSTLSSPSSSQCLSQKHVNIVTVTVILIAIIYKLISLVLIFLRGALDAALIFASEEELDKSLFWIIGTYIRFTIGIRGNGMFDNF